MSSSSAGYFFIHIPKTAGTSFRRMLYTEFPGDAIYPTHDEIVEHGGNYPGQSELSKVDQGRKARAKILVGHYPIAAGTSFFGSTQFAPMTFVRDPFERALSNLLHLKRHAPEMVDFGAHKIIDEAPHQLSNLQVRFLSGVPGPLSAKHLDAAIDNLERLAFLGITEQFSESISRARSSLGWSLIDEIETNVRPADSPTVAADVVDRLRSINDMDQVLYDHACMLVDDKPQMLSAPGGTETPPAGPQRRAANRRQRFFERWLDPTAKGLVIATDNTRPVHVTGSAVEHRSVTPGQVSDWTWTALSNDYEYVVADGLLELVADPIAWLQGLQGALTPSGSAMIVTRDVRFGAQPNRPSTSIGAAIQAHREKATELTPASRFDSIYYRSDKPGPGVALQELSTKPDTHVVVTVLGPDSLREFIDTTRRLGYHQLVIRRVFHRSDHPGEFFTLLSTENDNDS